MYIRKRLILIVLVTLLVGGCLFSIFGRYKTDILKAVQDITIKMRNHRFGPLFMCLLIMITGTPPILGFTFTVTMTGFIYGFPYGCIPGTIGAFSSSLLSFGLIRKFQFSKWIQFSDKRQAMYQAMQDAITHGGFKMVLLIRICPLPWQLTNLILSLVPTVTCSSYLLSAFIACFKFNMDVWVGSQLANLSDPNLPPETHKVTLIYMLVGLVVLAVSGIWIYRLTMQKIQEQQLLLLLEEGEGIDGDEENERLLSSRNGSLRSYTVEEEEEDEDGDSTTIIVGSHDGIIVKPSVRSEVCVTGV